MKRIIYLFLLLLTVLACGKEESSSQAKDIALNGTWQFLASNDVTTEDVLKGAFSAWDTIQVPGNWDTRERYSEYVGKGYYKKSFEIPQSWTEKQIRLKFDAVYETAKVWLNGDYLGEHIGGYTPFEFIITDKVKTNTANSVMVMADNTYKRGAWWAWGGISRAVTLQANEDVRMVYQHITSIPDFENQKVNFTIKYKLENNASSTVLAKIFSKIKGVHEDSVSVNIALASTAITSIQFEKPLSDVELWHFNMPNLYELNSAVFVNNTHVDLASDKFGVRKFEVKGEQFYLNNEPVRMNGINRVHDHPDYGNTEPDDLVLKDMLDIKSLGCNFSRLMHAPLSKNLLNICDSIGFLVVEEIPVWGDDDPQAFPNNPLTKQWMDEMVERDYNHPSVVAWSVGNELREDNTIAPKWPDKKMTQKQYEYTNSMLDYVEQLDPSRLKTYVTITSYRQGEIGSEPYEKVDFISMNSYGPAPKLVKLTHEKFPGKPIFISEIGLVQIGGDAHSKLSDDLVSHIKKIKDLPYVTGVSVWSYNDYRSNYRGTPESGFREWGIVNENRIKKEAYHQLKVLYKNWDSKPLNNIEK